MNNQFVIDPEFQSLISPLAAPERSQLEENIQSEGCRDALVVWNGLLIDGHNRYEICSRSGIAYQTVNLDLLDRAAALRWIICNQLGRRNLTPFVRAELALRLKPVIAAQARENRSHGLTAPGRTLPPTLAEASPVETRQEIAGVAAIGRETLRKAEVIAIKATEPVKERLRSGETTIHAEYQKIVKAEQQQEKETHLQARQEEAKSLPPDDRCTLIHGSVSELHRHILYGTAHAIITDPPYGEESIGLYSELARMAAQVLRPGGSLLVMVGQYTLPQVIAAMIPHVRYHWTLTYLTPGGQSPQIWPRKVNTFWKPILWFTRGEYGGDWQGDVIKSAVNDNDKNHHHWGQSVSGMNDLVERFSKPGDLVVDPFLGGGTTAVVAIGIGRRFVGCDIDEKCLLTTRARIQELSREVQDEY